MAAVQTLASRKNHSQLHILPRLEIANPHHLQVLCSKGVAESIEGLLVTLITRWSCAVTPLDSGSVDRCMAAARKQRIVQEFTKRTAIAFHHLQ